MTFGLKKFTNSQHCQFILPTNQQQTDDVHTKVIYFERSQGI